ncbi:MAG: hypothetical protein OEZ58_11010 [Gammaproteobacteria bacterium]|nr:hypothetical protein [Gammaproteobacteria bacterium]
MAGERRTSEASGLRRFFDENLSYLSQLYTQWSDERLRKEQQLARDKQIIEAVVDASNSQLRVISGYRKKLRQSVCALYDYVNRVAEGIPSPILLNKESFSKNALVNALFVNVKELEELFELDQAFKQYFHDQRLQQDSYVYVYLLATRAENRTLGMDMMGEVMVRDVPQTSVNFCDLELGGYSASPDQLLTLVKKYLFDRVVENLSKTMNRKKMQEYGGNSKQSKGNVLDSLSNPQVYLQTMIDAMKYPDQLLSIEKTHLKLSKLGKKLNVESNVACNEFEIVELIWNQQLTRVILLAYYPKEEYKYRIVERKL